MTLSGNPELRRLRWLHGAVNPERRAETDGALVRQIAMSSNLDFRGKQMASVIPSTARSIALPASKALVVSGALVRMLRWRAQPFDGASTLRWCVNRMPASKARSYPNAQLVRMVRWCGNSERQR